MRRILFYGEFYEENPMKKGVIAFIIIATVLALVLTLSLKSPKTPAEASFSTVEQQEVQAEMDTISVTMTFTVKPYSQEFKRTAPTRFDIAKNSGEMTRIISASFTDSTDTVTANDTSLPDKSNGEYTSFAFHRKTLSQEFFFRTANNAPNTFKSTLAIEYLKGDSTAKTIDIKLLESSYRTLRENYQNQLLIETRPLAQLWMYNLLEKKGVNHTIKLQESVDVAEIPETEIKVRKNKLTYTTKEDTRFKITYTAAVPKAVTAK